MNVVFINLFIGLVNYEYFSDVSMVPLFSICWLN